MPLTSIPSREYRLEAASSAAGTAWDLVAAFSTLTVVELESAGARRGNQRRSVSLAPSDELGLSTWSFIPAARAGIQSVSHGIRGHGDNKEDHGIRDLSRKMQVASSPYPFRHVHVIQVLRRVAALVITGHFDRLAAVLGDVQLDAQSGRRLGSPPSGRHRCPRQSDAAATFLRTGFEIVSDAFLTGYLHLQSLSLDQGVADVGGRRGNRLLKEYIRTYLGAAEPPPLSRRMR